MYVFYFRACYLSGPGQALWCTCYGITRTRLSWLEAGDIYIYPQCQYISIYFIPENCSDWRLGKALFSIITVKMYFFQKCLPSPVLARRYSAYATAFTRTRLSWLGVWRDQPSPGRVEESLLYSRKQFLWSGSSVIVLMPRHLHAQDCLNCGPEINICTCIYKSM